MNKLSDWLAHIESFHPSEIELGLDRIKLVAEKLGLLNIAKKVILVTGTNGKGSCVAMLESLGLNQGKKIGCYTSPHLLEFNERIRINGKNVADDPLVEAFKQIEKQRAEIAIALTFFEFTTLAAFYLFKKCALDLVILEIGLGGRHDATNIIEPDISVITTVDIDHVSWLGHDLEDIAYEKGGIIRSGKTCFSGDLRTYDLLNKVLPEFKNEIQLVETATNEILALLNDPLINQYHLLAQNILLAVNSFNNCFNQNLTIENISRGLKNICLQGRFQVLMASPLTIIDVAHNPQSASNLIRQLSDFKKQFNIQKISAICGMMADKAIDEVLTIIDPIIDQWCFVDLNLARAIKSEGLELIYLDKVVKNRENKKTQYQCFNQVSEAHQWLIEQTKFNNKNDQLIIVFGSFITVANMLQYNQKMNEHKTHPENHFE